MLGAILSAAAPIVGSLLTNSKDNKASAKAAEAANQFTTEQMQNRHQWEVEDLRKAGLNPILSAGGTPSMGSSAKADVSPSSEAFSKGVNSALAVQLQKEQINNLRAQSANQLAQAGNASAQTIATNIANTRTGVTQPLYNIAGKITNSAASTATKYANPDTLRKIIGEPLFKLKSSTPARRYKTGRGSQ